MTKKLFTLLLCVSLVGLLASCSKDEDESASKDVLQGTVWVNHYRPCPGVEYNVSDVLLDFEYGKLNVYYRYSSDGTIGHHETYYYKIKGRSVYWLRGSQEIFMGNYDNGYLEFQNYKYFQSSKKLGDFELEN